VGGSQLDFPGDTTTPMDDWVGCRCSQMFLPAGNAAYGATRVGLPEVTALSA
jgi:hypothetical protein